MNRFFAKFVVSRQMFAVALLVFLMVMAGAFYQNAETVNGAGDDTESGDTIIENDDTMQVKMTIDNPVTSKKFDTVYSGVIDFVFSVAIIIVPIIILVGALVFVTAAGDPGKITLGKQIVFWGLVALGIIILAKGVIILVRLLLGQKLESAISGFVC